MTEGFYKAEPLLQAFRSVLEAGLPADFTVDISATDTKPRFVNIWPGAPETVNLTLGGPTLASLTLQVTVVGEDRNDARKTASTIRATFGRDRLGQFLNPIVAPGFNVLDVTASNGHSDSSGGVDTWVENYDVAYQAHAV